MLDLDGAAMRRCLWLRFLALGVAIAGVLCGTTGPLAAQEPAREAARNGISEYEVRIEGAPSSAIRGLLRSASQLVALDDKPPQGLAGLRRRAEADMERLRIVLKSEGYYLGRTRFRIDEDADPVTVIVSVDPGPAFPLRSFTITYDTELPDEARQAVPRRGGDVGLEPPAVAKGPAIVSAQGRAVAQVRGLGFPFISVADRSVLLDLEDEVVDVTLRLSPGPLAMFGVTQVSGLDRVERPFVDGYIPWRVGERYDPDDVALFAERLQRTGLFRTVRVRIAETVADDGTLPVLVDVEERARRTLGTGVRYSTSEGPGGSVFWEHRNLSGEGEKLRLDLSLARIRQSIGGRYEEPQFLRADQTLVATATAASEETDAFDSRTVLVSLGVDRQLSRTLQIGVAGEFEYARTIEDETKTDTYLFALPVTLALDTTDNPLNPKFGLRLKARLAPITGFNEGPTLFTKNEVTLNSYQSWGDRRYWTLATRARVGTINGEDTDSIPAQRRFYAGGGGSLRGFAFQEAGPLDTDRDPLGGRSVVELGAELRVNVTPAIGVVPFFETGSVFDDPWPNFEEGVLNTAGFGVWYDTPVGPFRADLAFPLNRRSGVDSAFQIYVSLGQAF